ncbi:MAG: hypothetical protein R2852_03010 [Bacteroidia bacterium]
MIFISGMTLVDKNDNIYFPIEFEGDVVFRYPKSEYFVKNIDLKEKKVFKDKAYSSRLTKYSWGVTDTSYFRSENETVYYYDVKSNTESVQMPKDIKIGVSWTSTDSAWNYEITNIQAKLKTPVKKYKDLLEIKATQLKNRDKKKLPEYLIYYMKNVGKVASVTKE